MRILFTGGGTGGHFYPNIAVIRELKRIAEEERILELQLYYMGPRLANDESALMEAENVLVIPVTTGKIRRYPSIRTVLDLIKIPVGICQGIWNTFLIMPDAVFSKGGYGAFPAVIAAIMFRIPLMAHESDAVPGIVNKIAGRFAARIAIAFPGAGRHFLASKTALVGVPIRKHTIGGRAADARAHFNIASEKPVVAFIGASQGSAKLNGSVIGVLRELTDAYEILHQTGKANYEQVEEETKVILEFAHHEHYHPVAFLAEGDMRLFYAAADLIVSRAGASSIYEIAASGKPSILIPLRSAAQEHQRENAYEYASTGAALIVEEENLSPHILLSEIQKAIGNSELLQNMSRRAQKFARLDAAQLIAREILKLGLHE